MKESTNKYSKLLSNTIIFAIGSFSSKILVFLLIPLYTRALNQDQYGSVDLIIQIANLLLPVATLSIAESIIRFGLDKKYKKSNVFSTGVVIVIMGLLIFTLFAPLLAQTKNVKGYGILLYIYIFTASFKLIFSEFVRARNLVKLYAFNGLLTTFMMIVLNIIFLLVFKMGILGYILAIVLSDLSSIIFLFVIAEIYKFFSIKKFSKDIAKQMLAFSVPLIPTAVMWWVTNVSDRFIVKHFLGAEANGVYAISYKIPTILLTVYAMFNKAWNISAIEENDSKGKSKFYKNVFNSNQSVLYVLGAGIMLFLIPLTKILVGPDFFISYKYAPLLIVATVFTCFSSFLGSIYSATKRTKHSFTTSTFGAAVNVALNFILIPEFGINGASFATFVSYILVFSVRIIDIQRISPFKVLPGKIIINTVLLLAMAFSTLYLKSFVLVISLVACFILIFLLNYTVLIKSMKKVVPTRILNRIPILNKI